MPATVDEIRARFERLAKKNQPKVVASGRTVTVRLDNGRTVSINQAGSSSLQRRAQTRYR